MKSIKAILAISIICGSLSPLVAQSDPTNIDYGVFDPGTYDATPPANATFEFAIRPNINFPSVPAAAELNLFLGLPTVLFAGTEVFTITEDNLSNGDMIWDPLQTYSHSDGNTYFVFAYNGGGINLAPFGNGNFVHAFTIYVTGLGGGADPSDFFIADASSALWADFGIRSSLNVSMFNEFMEMATAESLPLDLIKFTAEKSGTHDVLVEWSTVNEVNTSHFIIQRSYNQEYWLSIGEKKAAGFSTEVKNYAFTDFEVYNGRDKKLQVYYRLIMMDIDGKVEISPIESVVFGNNTLASGREFSIYPNPASEGVHVEWDANEVDQPTAIELYDVAGKLILSVPVSDQTNQQYIDFKPTRVQSGLYLMRIMHHDEALEHKQIVVGRAN